MLFVLANYLVSLAVLAVASIIDLRERLIPNKLTYSLIAFALASKTTESFVKSDWSILGFSIALGIATFCVSWLLWKLGVWAGGDVKLFTALAFANPFNPAVAGALLGIPLLQAIPLPIFPLTLFIFSVFSVMPFGAMIAVRGLQSDAVARREIFESVRGTVVSTAKIIALALGLNAVLVLFGLPQILVLPLLFIAAFLPAKAKPAVSAGLFAFALWQSLLPALSGFLASTAAISLVYIFLKLFAVSKRFLVEEKPVSELAEGDIPAKSFFLLSDGNVAEKEPLSIKTIINHLKANKLESLLSELKPQGREIASSIKARGLTEEELSELKKLCMEKRIPEKILVKKSAAFAPSVLIAFVLLGIAGDLLWKILGF
ncbi:MAG: prepilin peptidase [Candidatus Diapherotrites archaeon]|nr:prepilin peptidase [Candidatus Diapherotrites archaeon]